MQAQQIITAFHYPPLFARTEHTCFTNLMLQYGVQHCVYGHIHGENHIPVLKDCAKESTTSLFPAIRKAFSFTR